MTAGARTLATAAVATALSASMACGGCRGAARAGDGGGSVDGGFVSAPSATAAGAPRSGMIWIPAGILRAGTPLDKAPRVAEEELPGTEIPLGGFYIDALPYPNEAGAIPSSNVTRDEAAHLCDAKGKRLCTELEWERSCKGPDNTTYEYGDVYRAAICGMGVAAEQAGKEPSGERLGCRSVFGVLDLHGGVWEWTVDAWGRESGRDLGVLRGGNAVAGEIAGRCANALARPPSTKSPAMGFRCCAGPPNEAKVELSLKTGVPLDRSMKTREFTDPLRELVPTTWQSGNILPFVFQHAWTWHPVANEELVIATGCGHVVHDTKCGLLVARGLPSSDGGIAATAVSRIDTGTEASEIAQVGDARHLRFKGKDAVSPYLRDFTYAYGRIELGEIKR
jgi:sulfatase modifying factor 1